MDITIKESMVLRKCINNYVLENNLDYDKSPLFNDLIYKLKDVEKCSISYKHINDAIKKDNLDYLPNKKASEFIENHKKEMRKSLNKDLKKYIIQTTCNKKILELMEIERVESINKQKELIK